MTVLTYRASRARFLFLASLASVACKGSSSGTHPFEASFPDGGLPPKDAAADVTGAKDASKDAKNGGGSDAFHQADALSIPEASIPDVHRGEAPPPMGNFCSLPGSIVWSGGAPSVVPGGPSNAPDFTWMHLPDGYCSHWFGTVPETRQLRFSPSGDLFVASPSTPASGGASGGMGAIVVLPDDNHDGVADSTLTYLGGIATTQGLLFYNGSFYYQNGTGIWSTPWAAGDRMATGSKTQVLDVTVYTSGTHWPKVLDVDDNGNIYVTNGGDEGEQCDPTVPGPERPFHGGILKIDGTPNGTLVAKGLRNAYALRCAKGTGMCFGLELARDFAPELGSREKLFPVEMGDDWGFPCCATANTPYSDYTSPAPDCSTVSAEEDSFIIDHTPFALDFEEGFWAGEWKYRAFVGMHGYFGSWVGARVVGIATDSRTGWPVNAMEADQDASTAMLDFATGWDDGKNDHGRPAALTFAPDGRMFVGNDIDGTIVWIAPVTAKPLGDGGD
jgi:glucose/arabinose dehydrogenase